MKPSTLTVNELIDKLEKWRLVDPNMPVLIGVETVVSPIDRIGTLADVHIEMKDGERSAWKSVPTVLVLCDTETANT